MKQSITTINLARLAIFQGVFYMLTGIWPILHMDSFIAVTGPKVDLWLVRTVGMLIFFIGTGIFTAGIRKQVNISNIIIAAGAAFGLMVVDVTYVWLDVISPIYLLDAVVELILVILWIILVFKNNTEESSISHHMPVS